MGRAWVWVVRGPASRERVVCASCVRRVWRVARDAQPSVYPSSHLEVRRQRHAGVRAGSGARLGLGLGSGLGLRLG